MGCYDYIASSNVALIVNFISIESTSIGRYDDCIQRPKGA